jgi:hypothetical protein
LQRYPVRASHRPNLRPEALVELARTHFEETARDGESITGHFGAISRLVVKGEGRELSVDLTMDPKVSEETARETIARYNRFLADVTGYTAKERASRMRKSATS